MLPKTIAEALKIDKETGTTLWSEAIEEELLVFTSVVAVPISDSKEEESLNSKEEEELEEAFERYFEFIDRRLRVKERRLAVNGEEGVKVKSTECS
jgi:hypothetical protein